jgi:hypothetical protein
VAARQPGDEKPDDRSPLPPIDSKRTQAAKKYGIPNKNRMIFTGKRDPKTGAQDGGIVDLKPIAKETENKNEYDAWHEVVQHAAQFAARELEEHAGRDWTHDDLTGSQRHHYRLELLRVEGKLTRVRRLQASRSLRDAGTGEVFEALVVPLDEPPTELVSVVFTELPEALAALRTSGENQWVVVDSWAIGAGYFFKTKLDSPGEEPVPVLIGRSLQMRKDAPSGSDSKNPAALDKTLRVFRHIRDNAPIARGEENWEEVTAWNRVLLHAHRFSPEELETNARTDLTFYDLFKDIRRDYQLELVKFEGRLIQLKKVEPSKKLRAAGIETAYEGWLVPRDEPRGNPICIVFTDVPEGIEPVGRVNRWVSFAGYSFKLLQYESGERDRYDPAKNVWKKAPLLIGRAVIIRPDPESTASFSWGGFATVATIVVVVLVVAGLSLSWWYRRGDRGAHREISATRTRNPFGDPQP